MKIIKCKYCNNDVFEWKYRCNYCQKKNYEETTKEKVEKIKEKVEKIVKKLKKEIYDCMKGGIQISLFITPIVLLTMMLELIENGTFLEKMNITNFFLAPFFLVFSIIIVGIFQFGFLGLVVRLCREKND